ncbi:MAG: hypothetical protein SPL08_00670 [Pseudomonadota bacterium]|nr:hypothetical protein [Pseudomonadota bacterium]
MKKQHLQHTHQTKKSISVAGMRGIAQSFVNVGIPTVLESSVRDEYSYFKRQGSTSVVNTFTKEIQIKL